MSLDFNIKSKEDNFSEKISIIITENIESAKEDDISSLVFNLYLCINKDLGCNERDVEEIASSILESKEKVLSMKNLDKFIVASRNRQYLFVGQIRFIEGEVLLVIEQVIENTSTENKAFLTGEYLIIK